MKADMKAMKEQMATMMEAMMSMKKIMEANVVAIAATNAIAKVNPMPPSDLNQMNHPTSDMVGKDLGSMDNPHLVRKTSMPSHCHTVISSGSTCGRSLNLVCSLRNPRNKHRCIIHKVSQHFKRKMSIFCVIHKISQHFRKKSIKKTQKGGVFSEKGGANNN